VFSNKKSLTLISFVGLTSFALVFNTFIAGLYIIGQDFGIKPDLMGVILGVYFIGFAISSSFNNSWSEKFGIKPVFIAGYAANFLCLLTLPSVQILPLFYLIMFIMGLGGGIMESATTTLMLKLHSDNTRGIVTLSQAFFCIGAIAGGFIAGVAFGNNISWRVVVYIVAGVSSIGLVLQGFADYGIAKTEPSAGGTEEKMSLHDFLSPVFIALCVLLFIYVYYETAIASWIPYTMKSYFGTTEPVPQWTLSGFWVMMIIGRLLLTKVPEQWNSITMITILYGVLVPITLLLLFVKNSGAAVVLYLMFGGACAVIWPLIVAVIGSIFKKNTGTFVGLAIAAGATGAGLAPILSGITIENWGVVPHFIVVGVMIVLSFLITLKLKNKIKA